MAMTYMSFLLKYHLISVFLTEYLKQNLFRPMELELPEDLSPYSTGNSVCVGHQTQMKSTQKNMKCTWPTQKFDVWYPTQPIFH